MKKSALGRGAFERREGGWRMDEGRKRERPGKSGGLPERGGCGQSASPCCDELNASSVAAVWKVLWWA